VPWP